MAQSPKAPEIEETIKVSYKFDGGPASYSFDLTEGEFWGIGWVTVQWAFLETVIAIKTFALANASGMAVPKDARNFSFARRLRAFRLLADEVVKDAGELKLYREHVAKIARLAGQRQRVAHHVWFYNPRAPEKIWSVGMRDPKARTEPFDPAKLHELGEQMGEAAYALMNPENPTPSLLEIWKERMSTDGSVAFVSRSFLLKLREISQRTQNPRPDKPPKRKRPRPSSKD